MGKRVFRSEAAWLIHAVGFGSNPLRRGVDRLTGLATIAIVLIGLLAIPICATAASVVHEQQSAEVSQQAADRHQTVAVLTENAKIGSNSGDGARVDTTSTANVQWQDARRQPRSAVIPVQAGAVRGDTTTLWLDKAGNATDPPRSQFSVTTSAVLLAMWLVLVVELVLWALLTLVRRLGFAYASRAWEHEWEMVERSWKWPQY